MKSGKRTVRRTLQKENSQSNQSETTVRCNNPDLVDKVLNKIHPVLGYAGDFLQSSGKPYSKMESKQSGLGQTIVEQVKSINESVKDIIKNHVKVPNEVNQINEPKQPVRPKVQPYRPVPPRYSGQLTPITEYRPNNRTPIPQPKPKINTPIQQYTYNGYPDVVPVRCCDDNSCSCLCEASDPIGQTQLDQSSPSDPNNPYASLAVQSPLGISDQPM